MTEEKKTTTTGQTGSGSKKAAYREERESALRELDAKLDELKKKTLEMTAGTREDLDGALQALGEKRKRFVAKMAGLRDTSGDAWDDLKKGVDNSWNELEDSFGDFRKGVSSAIGRFRGDSKS
ncbi:MAG: hypothetical protein OEM62_09120 [Acidobacteriota bacterium]|nr:hypothetical protein [Acidobacteriota bacterium]